MASPTLLAAVVLIVPTAAAIWGLVGRYQGFFDDRRIFFAMGLGLFAALVVRFLEVRYIYFDYPQALQGNTDPLTTGTLVYSFSYTAMGFAMLAGLALTAVVGFGKFRMRKDTPYYGAAAGLTFGGIWAMEFVAAHLVQADGRLVTETGALVFDAFVALLAVGIALAHGGAGAWIGRAAGQGKLSFAVGWGILWLLAPMALLWLWENGHDQVLPSLAAFGWGLFALLWGDRRVLQAIVPPEIRDRMRRERRRQMRREAP